MTAPKRGCHVEKELPCSRCFAASSTPTPVTGTAVGSPNGPAHVGQPWDTYDAAPGNLYNIIWRLGQWIMNRAGPVAQQYK
jgi:hypothetical protein